MERREALTGDLLGFGGAARGSAALRRLDAASARIASLEDAGSGLAALTRVRLADLTSPERGDGALAAVLARLASAAGADDGAIAAPAPRRLGVPVSLARHVREASVAPELPEGRARRGASPAANGRPVPFALPEPLASRRRTQATVPEPQRGPAFVPLSAVEAPDAPNGFEVADAVHGLEWLAVRVPGGAESSETPLVDDATEVSPVRHALAASAAPGAAVARASRSGLPGAGAVRARTLTGDAELRAAAPADVGWRRTASSRRRHAGTRRARARVAGHAASAVAGAGRAFRRTGRALLPRIGSGPGGTGTASRVRAPESPASEREEETLVFGDALARVLVGELRRYGIEVDAG